MLRGALAAGWAAPVPGGLTFIGRRGSQFPEAAEDGAAEEEEEEEDGEVTVHVAGAEGSERSISP